MNISKYLVVRADGTARIIGKRPYNLRLDEFAFRLNISIPKAWAQVVGEINLTLPDTVPTVEVTEGFS